MLENSTCPKGFKDTPTFLSSYQIIKISYQIIEAYSLVNNKNGKVAREYKNSIVYRVRATCNLPLEESLGMEKQTRKIACPEMGQNIYFIGEKLLGTSTQNYTERETWVKKKKNKKKNNNNTKLYSEI